MARAIVAAALLLLLAGAVAWWLLAPDRNRGRAAADLSQGQALYQEYCAACHGADLSGQPDWRRPGAGGRLPAPPHDETGHTWHHSDRLLLAIMRDGTASVVGGGYESDMPGFGEDLDDRQLRDILAWIKSQWPEREAGYQRQITAQESESR